MNLYQNSPMSVHEYFTIREKSEDLLEYIDGMVYMSPSPSTAHQRISRKLLIQLDRFLNGKPCEVFHAPFDIELKTDNSEEAKIVIPDLSVICDKSGLTESRYVGMPTLIVEILSPSNQAHDLITKLNLYMNVGVKEYWIVNPMLRSVTVYSLNEEGLYEQHDIKTEGGVITSEILQGFSVDLKEIFQ
ncbi:Uma2 family endonuclease [Bacillus sp. B15-48]|uniref:Uma2 family endonuclease n=1 Tax=Bacillus sp. B15-48 TaxID=1548601 RepID=UPI00193EC710|nr:Uma2 family endonuclease [Bacillus sp. B15-48]MBM4764749.1 Uma2 family endonuclease [Bacillus sp. B15-48]